MSTRINLHCDTLRAESVCATQLMTDADSIPEARHAARARGWRCNTSGDYCPSCSGQGPQPASAVIAVLHPERTQ